MRHPFSHCPAPALVHAQGPWVNLMTQAGHLGRCWLPWGAQVSPGHNQTALSQGAPQMDRGARTPRHICSNIQSHTLKNLKYIHYAAIFWIRDMKRKEKKIAVEKVGSDYICQRLRVEQRKNGSCSATQGYGRTGSVLRRNQTKRLHPLRRKHAPRRNLDPEFHLLRMHWDWFLC